MTGAFIRETDSDESELQSLCLLKLCSTLRYKGEILDLAPKLSRNL